MSERSEKHLRIAIVLALVAAVGVVFAMKAARRTAPETSTAAAAIATPPASASLPRLVDLGADKCAACKMMTPVLDDLKKDYAGQLEVEFIDVWKTQSAAQQYRIKVIPTQIFFDAEGTERWRHEGYFSKEDILKKWGELGVRLTPPKS